jgi:hypothetical protein
MRGVAAVFAPAVVVAVFNVVAPHEPESAGDIGCGGRDSW